MVKIKITMPSRFKKELDDNKGDKATITAPEIPTEMNIIMPSLLKKDDDKLEKAAGVPQLPTKPRTERKLLNKPESQKIVKKSATVRKVKKLRLDPESLRKKIESIQYSRDYSFLFSVDQHQPIVRKSPPVKYPMELPTKQMPAGKPKPTPWKHSTETSSKQTAADPKYFREINCLRSKNFARRR